MKFFKKKSKDEELDQYFTDKKFRNKKGKIKRTQAVSFKIFIFSVLTGFFILTGYLFYLSQTLPSLEELENPKLEEATKIYSDNGELIDKFFLQNRTQVTIDNVSEDMINTLIAVEDRKFYDHWGVDVPRIVQAFIKNILRGDLTREGASTITQQLARNLYKDIGTETSLNRKLREAMTAVQIERTYTKKEILAYYLNTVYFGNGAYGIEAAAKTYFNKSAKDLDLIESAALVSILRNPSFYDPVDKPENNAKRRAVVLFVMFETGHISKETYELTSKDPLKLSLNIETQSKSTVAPEFSEHVRQQLQKMAQTYGFDLYRDGLKVYTTLDTRFQKHADDAVIEQLKGFQKQFNGYWNWKNNSDILNDNVRRYIVFSEAYKKAKTEAERNAIYERMKNDKNVIDSVKKLTTTIQIGLVCINPKTGEIKAMVGANPLTRTKYGLNHVTQIKRQPGSTFKSFVYALALQNGYSPGYMISNDPVNVNVGGKTWSPKGGGTGGKISMRTAMEKSINVVAVRTAMELAPIDKVIELSHNMGIKSELPNYLSLALGAGEVTPLEITNAFGVFANEGIWVEPIAIKRIEDRNGNVIAEFIPETKEVLNEGVAYMMSDMMEGVIEQGTATSVRRYFHRPAAGKTGTTQNYTDAWFIGYTPQFVTGVWVGFDDARIKFGGSYGQGGYAAAPIWGRFMKYVYNDKEFDFPVEYFYMPEDLEEVGICSISGLMDNGSCPSTRELVLKRNLPRKCNVPHYLFSDSTSVSETSPPGTIGY
ncbi:MAG TPA: PBP1A family penicillin-binding protein [Ignavibacteria bacterium]|nr:PBP1A family penicillin-binding protein [Ignavibacteria bacterium]